ncbi:MAG: porin [Bacteroidia bacterium]|nr:porin [Bacteroidia bacterium]
MNKKLTYLFTLLVMISSLNEIKAQGSTEYGGGIKLKLNEDGSKYVRFIMWNQIWMRYIQNNPGTQVNGVPANVTTDIGARRLRFLAYAQITPRYLVLTHFGINNQTFLNGGAAGTSGTGGYGAGKKPGIFFHDVWNEYAVIPAMKPGTKDANKFSLYAGFGLHYWHGVSRMASASTLNFLTIDAPIFNWYNIENSDQFARQYGVYLKGKAGKLDYRVHLNRPFATDLKPVKTKPNVAVDNNGGEGANQWSYGGYFMYQFKDQESNVLPFTVGTYVGTKKVFNIGAGYYINPKGTMSYQILSAGDTALTNHNIALLGGDIFLDYPFAGDKNMAVTLYSCFYNYNYGPNYLRNVGIMNVGVKDATYTGTDVSDSGYGNARPLIGTGNIWYTQAGYLLPKNISSKVRLQPFVAYTYKNFEALNKATHYIDTGCNLFIDGHHSKLTLQYSSRPTIQAGNPTGTKGELMLQTQIYL